MVNLVFLEDHEIAERIRKSLNIMATLSGIEPPLRVSAHVGKSVFGGGKIRAKVYSPGNGHSDKK